jgi:hypothetical protein
MRMYDAIQIQYVYKLFAYKLFDAIRNKDQNVLYLFYRGINYISALKI